MTPDKILFAGGTLLLAVAALIGFVQYRFRHDPKANERWRVVHAGGTGAAIQLLVLAAVFERMSDGFWTSWVLLGVQAASWAFFFGPLAQALGRKRTASVILRFGAVLAVPSYGGLPLLLLP